MSDSIHVPLEKFLDSTPEPLMYVPEIFGPTLQGEGRHVGTLAHFVRFGGCDYNCNWCDSPHAVQAQQFTRAEKLTQWQILERVEALGNTARIVVLTGGNPALFKLRDLVRALQDAGFDVHVETQGTRWADWLRDVDCVAVSPKPPSSGMKTNWPQLEQFILSLRNTPRFLKVPILPIAADIEYLKDVADLFPAEELFASVVTLPRDSITDLLRRANQVFELVKSLGPKYRHVKVMPQMHVLLWGHEKGR